MRNRRRVQQLSLLAVPRQQRCQLPKRSAPPARLQSRLALVTISRPQHRAQLVDKRNPALPELIANRQRVASPVPTRVICNPLQILWLQPTSERLLRRQTDLSLEIVVVTGFRGSSSSPCLHICLQFRVHKGHLQT